EVAVVIAPRIDCVGIPRIDLCPHYRVAGRIQGYAAFPTVAGVVTRIDRVDSHRKDRRPCRVRLDGRDRLRRQTDVSRDPSPTRVIRARDAVRSTRSEYGSGSPGEAEEGDAGDRGWAFCRPDIVAGSERCSGREGENQADPGELSQVCLPSVRTPLFSR